MRGFTVNRANCTAPHVLIIVDSASAEVMGIERYDYAVYQLSYQDNPDELSAAGLA
jgi:hypothetical protein